MTETAYVIKNYFAVVLGLKLAFVQVLEKLNLNTDVVMIKCYEILRTVICRRTFVLSELAHFRVSPLDLKLVKEIASLRTATISTSKGS